MLLRIAGKVLYRLFAETRWVVNQFLEAFLHPLSVSYFDTRTGKVTGRRPAFGRKAREWREANASQESRDSAAVSSSRE